MVTANPVPPAITRHALLLYVYVSLKYDFCGRFRQNGPLLQRIIFVLVSHSRFNTCNLLLLMLFFHWSSSVLSFCFLEFHSKTCFTYISYFRWLFSHIRMYCVYITAFLSRMPSHSSNLRLSQCLKLCLQLIFAQFNKLTGARLSVRAVVLQLPMYAIYHWYRGLVRRSTGSGGMTTAEHAAWGSPTGVAREMLIDSGMHYDEMFNRCFHDYRHRIRLVG